MRYLILLAGIFWLVVAPVQANDGLVTISSKHPVGETLDRFENAVRDAGMAVFARIDHAEGAQSVGLKLPPSQLLIFGNPKVGTLLMQSNPKIGQELPLRALAWQDTKGKVWLSYPDPGALMQRFRISDRPKIEHKLRGALEKFSGIATR